MFKLFSLFSKVKQEHYYLGQQCLQNLREGNYHEALQIVQHIYNKYTPISAIPAILSKAYS